MGHQKSGAALQAVILAAGSGERMGPLSGRRHKAMLRVGESTILARMVAGLQEVAIDVITVVTGHRADEVQDHLQTECGGPTYRFVHNPDYATTNNSVSLLHALDAIDVDADVLLAECDVLLGDGLLARLAGPDRGNLALVDRYRTGMSGTVVTLQEGLIAQVIPPSLQTRDFNYRDTYKTVNVYRFSSCFCRETLRPLLRENIECHDPAGYYETALAALGDLTPHRIVAEDVAGHPWEEVDDPHDLARARFRFEPSHRAAAVAQRHGGHWSFPMLDFAFMRNAYFPPEAMLAAMRHSLPEILGEYGSAQAVLNEKLGWFLKCDADRLGVLNGAAQAFPILGRHWAGRAVALPEPTFGEYARVFRNAVTYPDSPGVDLSRLDRVAREVDVVVVVNPNSPTGTTLPSAALHRLAARHPATRFLIDESFLGFSDQASIRGEIEDSALPNVVILCSLSKTLGVPGLRMGYLYSADRALVQALEAEIPIWNSNAVAEVFLELLPRFRPELEGALRQTKQDRVDFRRALSAEPAVAEVYPSGGNFLLVRMRGLPELAGRLRDALLTEEAIHVKDVTDRFADRLPRLRLAVRRPVENARLLEAMRRLHADLARGSAG